VCVSLPQCVCVSLSVFVCVCVCVCDCRPHAVLVAVPIRANGLCKEMMFCITKRTPQK